MGREGPGVEAGRPPGVNGRRCCGWSPGAAPGPGGPDTICPDPAAPA